MQGIDTSGLAIHWIDVLMWKIHYRGINLGSRKAASFCLSNQPLVYEVDARVRTARRFENGSHCSMGSTYMRAVLSFVIARTLGVLGS